MPDAPPKSSWIGPRFRRWLIVLAVLYVVGGVALVVCEGWLAFPAPGAASWVPAPSADFVDVELTSADGTRLHGWWCPKAGAATTVLFCHGNGSNVSHHGQGMLAVRDWLDANILLVDYPGYGKSEGSPSEAGCYAAGDAAYDWLVERQGVAPGRIVLFGCSMGGGVVTDLAARRDHRALVLFMTFTSMPDIGARLYFIYPVDAMMRTRFDNRSKLPSCKRPVFIAHGDADGLVPIGHSHALLELANAPKCGITINGLGHQEVMVEGMFRQLRAFLDEHAP